MFYRKKQKTPPNRQLSFPFTYILHTVVRYFGTNLPAGKKHITVLARASAPQVALFVNF